MSLFPPEEKENASPDATPSRIKPTTVKAGNGTLYVVAPKTVESILHGSGSDSYNRDLENAIAKGEPVVAFNFGGNVAVTGRFKDNTVKDNPAFVVASCAAKRSATPMSTGELQTFLRKNSVGVVTTGMQHVLAGHRFNPEDLKALLIADKQSEIAELMQKVADHFDIPASVTDAVPDIVGLTKRRAVRSDCKKQSRDQSEAADGPSSKRKAETDTEGEARATKKARRSKEPQSSEHQLVVYGPDHTFGCMVVDGAEYQLPLYASVAEASNHPMPEGCKAAMAAIASAGKAVVSVTEASPVMVFTPSSSCSAMIGGKIVENVRFSHTAPMGYYHPAVQKLLASGTKDTSPEDDMSGGSDADSEHEDMDEGEDSS